MSEFIVYFDRRLDMHIPPKLYVSLYIGRSKVLCQPQRRMKRILVSGQNAVNHLPLALNRVFGSERASNGVVCEWSGSM